MSYAADPINANTDEQYQEVKRRVYDRWGIEPGVSHPSSGEATESSFEQLVAAIEEKSGISREQIEAYVASIRAEVVAKVQAARAGIEPTLHDLDEKAREVAGQAAEQAKATYGQAESKVREKPMTALAVAFGVGIAAGLFLGAGRRA